MNSADTIAVHSPGGATLMGLLQGLTEFLPVSSSGHLVLGSQLLGLSPPSLFFNVLLHVATLIPIVAVYRRDIAAISAAIGAALLRPHRFHQAGLPDPALRLGLYLALGSLPAMVVGLALRDLFAALFASPRAVAVALLITGGILMLTRAVSADNESGPARRPRATLNALRALIIGCAQACAITPGISRSGATLAAGLLLGLDPPRAARFSFLLSLPAIVGAALWEGLKAESLGAIFPYAAGFIAAAVSGYIALRVVIRTVLQGKLYWFALYVWALGATVLIYLLWFPGGS